MFNSVIKIFLYCFSVFLIVSCAMDDEDADLADQSDASGNGYYSGEYTSFLIKFSYGNNYYFDNNISGNKNTPEGHNFDTIAIFPNDTLFHKTIMDCISKSQKMAYDVINSLFNPKLNNDTWRKFYEPYLGTYKSPLDSRIKQWEVLTEQSYLNTDYAYCLKISDMPTSLPNKDDVKENAVEFFYNENFDNGVIVFSPVNYDRVKYPENVYGKNLVCLFNFNSNKDSVVNELLLTGNSFQDYLLSGVKNIYLRLVEYQTNGFIKFQALVDMPNFWLDSISNAGYCVCVAGAVDNNDKCSIFYTGLVSNKNSQTNILDLITSFPSGKVLSELYPVWKKNTGEENSDLSEDFVAFDNPAFFLNGEYMGCGKNDDIKNFSFFQKLINISLSASEGSFRYSPYQNSIFQILW